MRTLDSSLLPDEKILFRTQKHYIVFLPAIMMTAIAFYFVFNHAELVAKYAIFVEIAALLTWINNFLIYVTADFAVTDKRIIMKEGFFFRHTNEMRLMAIANASVDQSLLGQILNYGTVFIHTFGGDRDPFTLIARPNEFQKYLQKQLDVARH